MQLHLQTQAELSDADNFSCKIGGVPVFRSNTTNCNYDVAPKRPTLFFQNKINNLKCLSGDIENSCLIAEILR